MSALKRMTHDVTYLEIPPSGVGYENNQWARDFLFSRDTFDLSGNLIDPVPVHQDVLRIFHVMTPEGGGMKKYLGDFGLTGSLWNSKEALSEQQMKLRLKWVAWMEGLGHQAVCVCV